MHNHRSNQYLTTTGKIIMKNLVSALVLAGCVFSGHASSALSVPGYMGSISNNSPYVLECAQMLGGYCANNPMPANGFIQMLPDPGSTEMRFQFMLFSKDVPGKYVDNISFTYKENKDGNWSYVINNSYNNVKISAVLPDTLLLTKK
jgi:hypothetical protein